jgi:methyl-accepting chemotaxis protein
MALTQEDLEKIDEHVKSRLNQWLSDLSFSKPPHVYEIELRERMVRVEEELKNQRELMKQGFDMMDKRFEDMLVSIDKRFEDVLGSIDKRFEDMQGSMDKRFEQVDKRFEQVDKRFEQVDKRFEDVNSRFTMMFAFMTLGFTVLAVMMTIFKFIR